MHRGHSAAESENDRTPTPRKKQLAEEDENLLDDLSLFDIDGLPGTGNPTNQPAMHKHSRSANGSSEAQRSRMSSSKNTQKRHSSRAPRNLSRFKILYEIPKGPNFIRDLPEEDVDDYDEALADLEAQTLGVSSGDVPKIYRDDNEAKFQARLMYPDGQIPQRMTTSQMSRQVQPFKLRFLRLDNQDKRLAVRMILWTWTKHSV